MVWETLSPAHSPEESLKEGKRADEASIMSNKMPTVKHTILTCGVCPRSMGSLVRDPMMIAMGSRKV